tara:strand:+ start:671 stop:970 length:300 start_codon:yes stop_codon:yes gene_type:complete
MTIGHNSTNYGGIEGAHLRQYIEKAEQLNLEKQGIADDIKEVFAEARSQGFDTKIMRQVIKIRKKDAADREEEETLMDIYMHALGMLPLEQAIEDTKND